MNSIYFLEQVQHGQNSGVIIFFDHFDIFFRCSYYPEFSSYKKVNGVNVAQYQVLTGIIHPQAADNSVP